MAHSGFLATDRAVLRISGKDHARFLQDLVTNDLAGLKSGAVYAGLLTPQGKYLFDFFMLPDEDAILIDVKQDRAAALAQRLSMYKLRAAVTIETSDCAVVQVFGDQPTGDRVFADPRSAALGWRVYTDAPEQVLAGLDAASADDWTRLRVENLIPETGVELKSDDSYILEQGFERLNGVDFRKGCYVGQEVTARMKHKTELRKGLARVRIDGALPDVGTKIVNDDKDVGEILSGSGTLALAYLRFDRAEGPLRAGDAVVELEQR